MSSEFDALPEPIKERFTLWAEGLSTDDYPVHPHEIFSAAVLLPPKGLDVPAPIRKVADERTTDEGELHRE